MLQTIHRFHNQFSQSRRRPLLGPSPGWKRLLPLVGPSTWIVQLHRLIVSSSVITPAHWTPAQPQQTSLSFYSSPTPPTCAQIIETSSTKLGTWRQKVPMKFRSNLEDTIVNVHLNTSSQPKIGTVVHKDPYCHWRTLWKSMSRSGLFSVYNRFFYVKASFRFLCFWLTPLLETLKTVQDLGSGPRLLAGTGEADTTMERQ